MRGHEDASPPGPPLPEAAPDALRPPPGNPRFPLVDGLRAFAAIAVVITHTGFLSTFNAHGLAGEVTARLDVGVTLFFIISGFLLYRPFVAARLEHRPAPRIPVYARRRVLRIVPAYWLALTVLAIWPGLAAVHSDRWWVYYGFLQDFDIAWIGGGIQAAWSLCVEVQFYILLPVLAVLAARALRGRPPRVQLRAELGGLAALALLSVAVRTWTFHDPSPDTVSSTIGGTFLWFALGMGVAVASAHWHTVPVAERPAPLRLIARRPALAWLAAAALMLVTTQIGMPTMSLTTYDESDWLFGHLLYGAMALCFALPAMLGDPAGAGVPGGVLAWRPIAWLGLVSYGIFLWHHPLTTKLLPVQDWTSHGSFLLYPAVVLAAATACAAASYYLVERPL